MHITRELLWAFVAGELTLEELSNISFQHHIESCAPCREEFRAFQAQAIPTSHDQTLDCLKTLIRTELPQLAEAQKEAERWWQELSRLPPEKQKEKMTRARARFRGPVFADLLLDEVRRSMACDPRRALHCAELAEMAAMSCIRGHTEILALALAHQGNAYRGLADFEAAQTRFRQASSLCRSVSDIAAQMEINSMHGSLFLDLRDFSQAEQMFQGALQLACLLRDPREIAINTMALARNSYFAGEVGRAVLLSREALVRLADCDDEKLLIAAMHNLALYLTAAEEYEEASQLLRTNIAKYQLVARELPSWLHLFNWLAGKIALGQGNFEQAEAQLLQVEAHFRQMDRCYDVALVGLDLALLYVKRRRFADLCTRAGEVLALLSKYELHGEARQLLRAFELALAERKVSEILLAQLCRELEHSRRLACGADPRG